ncbi:MAG: hypothetical protein EOP53_01575 [Sphingobacteriales bacterium]|nr:MAG: hypothetical protein EOP53_01575 [Sphingobacteriales bacterium]
MKSIKIALFAAFAAFALSSCTAYNSSMSEGNVKVEFHKEDFTLSNRVSAEATSTKIIGIDWERLFTKKEGMLTGGPAGNISIAMIPVVGAALTDKTSNYALYELMQENAGYDVVFYPSFEKKTVNPIIVPFIFSKTTVKVTSRMGKLK